jgi:hypothetical protein
VIPDKEWERVKSVYVLRICTLNPFISHFEHISVVWQQYLEMLKKKIEQAIENEK